MSRLPLVADRDLAQRIDRAEQAELARLRDEAQADLWEGWYGFDEDDENGSRFVDGLTNVQKQFVDELVKDDRYTYSARAPLGRSAPGLPTRDSVHASPTAASRLNPPGAAQPVTRWACGI